VGRVAGSRGSCDFAASAAPDSRLALVSAAPTEFSRRSQVSRENLRRWELSLSSTHRHLVKPFLPYLDVNPVLPRGVRPPRLTLRCASPHMASPTSQCGRHAIAREHESTSSRDRELTEVAPLTL